MLVVLFVVCALCLALAVLAVVRLRPRLGKHAGAALSFAVPGTLAALPCAWLLVAGAWLPLVPLATIAVLCFCASALFAPTPATRFAAFERDFWAFVQRRA